MGRVDELVCRGNNITFLFVLAFVMQVLPLPDIFCEQRGDTVFYVYIFVTDNGIGGSGERCAGHYFYTFVLMCDICWFVAGGNGVFYFKCLNTRLKCCVADSDTIHGDTVAWRQVAVGREVFGEDTAESLFERDELGAVVFSCGQDDLFCFGYCGHLLCLVYFTAKTLRRKGTFDCRSYKAKA